MKKLILLSAILLSLSACNDPYPILKKHGLSKKDILTNYSQASAISAFESTVEGDSYSYILIKQYDELQDFIAQLKGSHATAISEENEEKDTALINSINALESYNQTNFDSYNFLILGETSDATYNADRYKLENIYYKDRIIYFHKYTTHEVLKTQRLFLYQRMTFFIGKDIEFDDIKYIYTDNYKKGE